MQTVVLVIMVLVCLNFIFKQTYRKWYSVAAVSVVAGLFIGFTYEYAIEQSKSQIDIWLSDTELMLDMAVLISIDVILQIAFCVTAAHIRTSEVVNRKVVFLYRMLRWFPGILVFPVLFSLLVYVIFALPGYPFAAIAWGTAIVVGCAIPFLTFLIRKLLPEKEIRLEFLFITDILIALLGVIATVNGRSAVAGVSSVDWVAFSGLSAILIAGFLIGLAVYKFKMHRQWHINHKS